MHRRDQFSERQLPIALGIGALILHGLGSTAWATYYETPSGVPVLNGLTETLFAIAVAIGLYALRCWWRTIYGLIEIMFATFIIYFGIAPAKQSVTSVCNGKTLFGLGCWLQSFLIVLAGIYVFVRGLDNMEARRLWSRFRASWQQYRAASRKISRHK